MHRRLFSVLIAPIFLSTLDATVYAHEWQSPWGHDLINQAERDGYLGNIDAEQKETEELRDMISALQTMQDNYFNVFAGTWPSAIDWTAAVLGTHVSATLSTLVSGLDNNARKMSGDNTCADRLRWENIVNKYYMQTALFYFGENAFALRNQAYDDMLWVVLGWLENVKFAEMYSANHWEKQAHSQWHGLQMISSAAHRARIFYDLASNGWETKLCDGGMVWNPGLDPYKNAITNELFTAASVAMYLYFPGDNNSSPFIAANERRHGRRPAKPHDLLHLENAVKSYKWLKESGMQSSEGLYQDGFHVSGWTRFRNGTVDPGTGECDVLNTMVYTYNQGVILSASRGLWLATGAQSYLDDGHYLIGSVVNVTGWQDESSDWSGLGRGGVLEEFCDHGGYCSQDGQTFKGIFFHHLSEFCRPLWPQEKKFVAARTEDDKSDQDVYNTHLSKCASYRQWIEHNAKAALKTRNKHGLFGMWWGAPKHRQQTTEDDASKQELPKDSFDYINPVNDSIFEILKEDLNDRGRGRTVESQSGGLAVLRAHWQWQSYF